MHESSRGNRALSRGGCSGSKGGRVGGCRPPGTKLVTSRWPKWRWLQAKPLRDGRAQNVLRRVGLLARWSTLAILLGSVYTLLFTSVNIAYSYLLLIPIFCSVCAGASGLGLHNLLRFEHSLTTPIQAGFQLSHSCSSSISSFSDIVASSLTVHSPLRISRRIAGVIPFRLPIWFSVLGFLTFRFLTVLTFVASPSAAAPAAPPPVAAAARTSRLKRFNGSARNRAPCVAPYVAPYALVRAVRASQRRACQSAGSTGSSDSLTIPNPYLRTPAASDAAVHGCPISFSALRVG